MYNYQIVQINDEFKWITFYCPYRRTAIATIDLQARTLHLAEINSNTKASERILKHQEKVKELYQEKLLNSKDFSGDLISALVPGIDQQ